MKALLLIVSIALLSPVALADQAVRQARVATGAQVTLAPSAKTPAQWTMARPNVRALRPRARGTLDYPAFRPPVRIPPMPRRHRSLLFLLYLTDVYSLTECQWRA
jgi:hypothetical protein